MFRTYAGVEERVDNAAVDLEWYLVEPDEPEGMVDTALHELGACLVAVEQELLELD